MSRDRIFVRERSTDADPIIVRAGIVCRQQADDTGQRRVSSLHFPGDLVNLDSCYLGVAASSVQALSSATIATCPRDEFMAYLSEHDGANRAVWIASLADAADARTMAANLARKSARGRVANLLCQIAFRLGEAKFRATGEFHQPLSQKQIGDVTALTSIHVNRVLRSLDEDGLLRRKGSNYVAPDIRLLSEAGAYDPDSQQQLRNDANLLLASAISVPGEYAQNRTLPS